MQRNVDLNFPQHDSSQEVVNGTTTCPVKVAELDWGGELPEDIPHEPEIILAADCVYFEVRGSAAYRVGQRCSACFISACISPLGGHLVPFSANRRNERDFLLLEETQKGMLLTIMVSATG